MDSQVLELIRAAVARSRTPEDLVPLRINDLKDLLDGYEFYLDRRGQSEIWVPGHVTLAQDAQPFTKRLERLKKDAEAATDAMTKLFSRVEPEGRRHLVTHFGHVVRSLTKVADEMMAVHREHFECKPKEQV
jgi:hypothetical protein